MIHSVPAKPDDLPASLVDVAETLGMRVALALIAHFGGLDVKFPKVPGLDHPVILALGETDGLAICQFLGGAQIYVPHARQPKSARAAVLRLEASGMDRSDIARALGLSVRHVRRVANRTPDTSQLDLFDK
jgi:hypothetical protein